MPRCSMPSLRSRSPTPAASSSSTVEDSRTPARIRFSTYSRLLASSRTESTPSRSSSWDSSSPAGPAPMITTGIWLDEADADIAIGSSLERERRRRAPHRDPAQIGEGVDVGVGATEANAGARVADAAERRRGVVVDGLVVDMDDPGRDLLSDLPAAHDIPRDDAQTQPVRRGPRHLDGVVDRAVRPYRCDRAEDLLGVRRTVLVDVGQHRGPVVQPVIRAAGGEPGATLDALGDEHVDSVALPFVDDRPEGNLAGVRIADLQLVGLRGEQVDVVDGETLRHQVAPRRHADLPLMQPRPPGAESDGRVEIGIVEDQQRRVAAQLQMDPLELLAGELGDPAADRGGSRERGDLDRGVTGNRLTDIG